MSIFGIHFKKPQNVVLVTQNNRIIYYTPVPKPIVREDRKIEPEFDRIINVMRSDGIRFTDYQYFIGTYNRKNKSFDINYILSFETRDGKTLLMFQDIAKFLREIGRTESYLAITGIDEVTIKQLHDLHIGW